MARKRVPLHGPAPETLLTPPAEADASDASLSGGDGPGAPG